jgi:hypothetical protein
MLVLPRPVVLCVANAGGTGWWLEPDSSVVLSYLSFCHAHFRLGSPCSVSRRSSEWTLLPRWKRCAALISPQNLARSLSRLPSMNSALAMKVGVAALVVPPA